MSRRANCLNLDRLMGKGGLSPSREQGCRCCRLQLGLLPEKASPRHLLNAFKDAMLGSECPHVCQLQRITEIARALRTQCRAPDTEHNRRITTL